MFFAHAIFLKPERWLRRIPKRCNGSPPPRGWIIREGGGGRRVLLRPCAVPECLRGRVR
ncbi:hypothetical protein OCAR_6342 [Afipia carboxidovorans OM5]|nr:hypothetical protein OCAR_6342 [Afipia carboxidovorans OM5]